MFSSNLSRYGFRWLSSESEFSLSLLTVWLCGNTCRSLPVGLGDGWPVDLSVKFEPLTCKWNKM